MIIGGAAGAAIGGPIGGLLGAAAGMMNVYRVAGGKSFAADRQGTRDTREG